MIVPDFANVTTPHRTGAEEQASTADMRSWSPGFAHDSWRPSPADRRASRRHGDERDAQAGDFEAAPQRSLSTARAVRIASVTVDDEAAASSPRIPRVFGHLRDRARRRPAESRTARHRLRGYRRGPRRNGIDGAWTRRRDRLSTRPVETLRRPVAAARRLADRVFVGNVRATIGAMAAARRLGLRITDDLSVVGSHDAPFTSYLDPPLTTVRMPLVEMGRQAFDQLLTLLNGELVEDTMVGTPPELVVRASAGSPSGA